MSTRIEPAARIATRGVDHPGQEYSLAAQHEHEALAEAVSMSYIETVVAAIVDHPRSQQKRIGPSEIGTECNRALLHKLNEDDEPPRPPGWKPTVGTAVHEWLEGHFRSASTTVGGEAMGRWFVEQRVDVGEIGGTAITGSTDLFDAYTGTVIDHKIVGPSMLRKYRAQGPSEVYRTQAHLYGRGWNRKGYDTKMVMIAFLPREGELDDSYIWTEPWDETVALAALERANALWAVKEAMGIGAALALYPPCDYRFCPWCAPEQQRAWAAARSAERALTPAGAAGGFWDTL